MSNNLITFFNSSLFDFISFAPFGHIPYFKSIGGPTKVLRKRPQKVEIRESERTSRAIFITSSSWPGAIGNTGKEPAHGLSSSPGCRGDESLRGVQKICVGREREGKQKTDRGSKLDRDYYEGGYIKTRED